MLLFSFNSMHYIHFSIDLIFQETWFFMKLDFQHIGPNFSQVKPDQNRI